MKKLFTAIVLTGAAVVAGATEIGVTAGRDYGAQPHANSIGVTIQTDVAPRLALGVSAERQTAGGFSQTRTAGTIGYDVLTYDKITLVAKGDVGYLDNRAARSGWTTSVGAGVEYAITPVTALTADWRYQTELQNRVSDYSGSYYAVGVKYKF